jgi:glycosyltransferase involved in cell wall biosynthesis
VVKNFLFVGAIFPPDIGGPATFLEEFSAWTALKGDFVSVIATGNANSYSRINKNLEIRIIKRGILPIRIIRFILAIRKKIRTTDYILSVGAFFETYVANQNISLPLTLKIPGDVVWERAKNNGDTTLDIVEFQNSKYRLKYQLLHKMQCKALQSANNVITPSRQLYDICANWGINKNKMKLIPNSVNRIFVENFQGLTKKEYDVLTVCRLTKWKGVEQVINACAKLNRKLLVVGDGPEKNKLKELAQTLNSDVTFIDRVEIYDMPLIYLKSRIFVLNSEYEGLPHAIIEARQMKLPTISRLGTGAAEVITSGSSGLLTDGTLVDLVQKIECLFDNEDYANFLAENGYQDNLKRFNQDINFQKVYDTIIKSG